MKTKVTFKKYGTFPDMDTVKEIILYGASLGKNKKQFMFKNFNNVVETKTFNDVYHDFTGLGEYLNVVLGLSGKKIAILSENSYYWISCFYAVSTSHMTCVPIDPKLSDEDITDIIIRSGSDAVIYTKDFRTTVSMIKSSSGVNVIHYLKMEEFYKFIEEGHRLLKDGADNYLDDHVCGDDLGYIVYTSGTTGNSKGVMLTQKNVASDGIATCRAMTASQAIAFLPFNHTLSWASALLASPLLAEWGYICPSLKTLQNDISDYKPQNFTAVPLAVETIHKKILSTAEKEKKLKKMQFGIKLSKLLMNFGIDIRRKLFSEIHENLGGNLEVIICGGAFLDEKYERDLYDIGLQVIVGYGLTECAPTITCNRLEDFKFGSVGKPLECNEIKILNPDDDGVGEICVKGSNVMIGYYNDPEATDEVFEDGWFKTGDYGFIDSEGFLFYKGRKKNLIVLSNGKNVSPEELEDKLSGIEYVKEVLVYEEDGQIVAEFFLDIENVPNASDLIKNDVNLLNKKLPSYKHIGKIKVRNNEFPKTTTLKIKRSY